MEPQKTDTHPRKGKQLNRDERIQIEVLVKSKMVPSEIARLWGVLCEPFSGKSAEDRLNI